MIGWAQQAADIVREQGAVVLVTVTRTQGSTPRETGARMLVSKARALDTIGGGRLEHLAVAQAHRLLVDRGRSFLQQDVPLGPLTGQCCGGRVGLLIERLDEASLPWLESVAAHDGALTITRRVTDGRMVRGVEPSRGAAPGVVLRDAAGAPATDARTWSVMDEVFAPARLPVLLFGAGHVGAALAPLLAGLDFALEWIDSRAGWMVESGPPLNSVSDPAETIASAPPGACFVVMTHSHDLDYTLVRAALARGDGAYVGLIGSATKRKRFLGRLAKDGIEDADARLTCPIGDLGVRDKAPAAIAACVAVELLRVRERA